jgi:hypothetical protein
MVRRGSFIGGQDNLSVPDAPTIGATSGALDGEVTVAFTAPSAVGDDPITSFGVSVFPATGTTKTFRVTVASGNLYGGGTGNVFYIDGVGNPALTLVKGFTYVFDQEDSSNSGHPFHFKNTSDSQYTTGVTVTGTAGQSGAKVTLVLAEDASEPSAYYCTAHGNGMGNTITLVAPSASDDPLGQAQYSNTGSSSPITVTGLTNGTSYVAKVWAINDYGNGPLSDATSSFSPVAPRAVVSLAMNTGGTQINNVDFFAILTTGNSSDFGDLTLARSGIGESGSSSTRGVFAGGYDGSSNSNVIDYITINTEGNATDFGDLTAARRNLTSVSNDTRNLSGGGKVSSNVNTIDYITIASTGNSTDFGDLLGAKSEFSSTGSQTRGLFMAGASSNVIEYVTFASTGNATDFGDLTDSVENPAGASSNTRGLKAGGSGDTNVISYVTIASTGNATDFGDLTVGRDRLGGTAGESRAVFMGGGNGNVIDYVTIASTGNATDFGDLTQSGQYQSALSNSHGGL